MLTSVRNLLVASTLAGAAFVAAPAAAQDIAATNEVTVSANAAIVSEYRFRGVDMSGGDPAIQGGIDVAHASGVYFGTWGSSLDEDTVGYGHTELDVFGGWTGEVSPGLTVDVGGIYYIYPNAPEDGAFDYVEAYASAGFTFGPGDLSVGLAYAPAQESLGDQDNVYLFIDAGVGVPGTPVTLSAHAGYTDGYLTYTDDSQAFDWSVGADVAVSPNVSLGAAYVGAEGDYAPSEYNFTDDTVVFTLSAGF